MAKKFAVEQAFGHAAAVERDIVFLPGAAQVMQATGDHFLAGAGFAVNQHVHRSIRDIENQLADLGHLRRAADQPGFEIIAVIEPTAQGFDFENELALFQRPAHYFDQVTGRKWFLHEVVSATAHGIDCQRHVAMTSNDDHRQVGVKLIDPAQQSHAVHSRQAHVGDDDAGVIRLQAALSLFGRGHGINMNPGQLHRLFATEANIWIIFNQKDGECLLHGASLSAAERGSRTTNCAPPSGVDSASKSPPKSRKMSREMVSPSPRPSPGCLVVKNGSNKCASAAGEKPLPLSLTSKARRPSSCISARNVISRRG